MTILVQDESAVEASVINTPPIVVTVAPEQQISVVTVAEQGPPGPPGGDEMPYARRTDFVGEDVIYKGEASPGSSENDPVWRIRKIVFVGDDFAEDWADGSAEFSKAWGLRSTYAYGS